MPAVPLAYDDAGDAQAPPLLLSSSLGTSSELWDPQVRPLSPSFRVIRYDHRGHGASPVPPGPYRIADLALDVIALLDRLGIERASFCGSSIGGMVGIWLAATAPERIDRLVIVCSSAHMPPASAWAERAATVRQARSPEPIADAVVARWLTPAYAAAHPEVVASLRAMLVSAPAEGYASCCEAIEQMNLRGILSQIVAPTLVIGGEFDLAAPPAEHGRLIADGIAGSRLEIVPAAHVPNVELAAEVTRLIESHLQADHQRPGAPA
jgi:3-oxoadipate enol-lactonase